ncbi:MAG TPA: hypothetical protein DCP08_02980 [Chloroflexi bacterium]|nr:hypothetical protein [Chloroflexota bacterium]
MSDSRRILGRGWPNVLGHPSLTRGFLWGAIALYVVTFSIITILKHEAFQTTAFDLGNMDQAVWNSLHGRLLPFTNWGEEGTRLAYHLDPVLILISPLYFIHSDPKTLLVFQTLVVALGALPLFWLAEEVFGESLVALVFPLVYLFFPALEAANLFDFHPTTLAASFLAYAFYYLYRRRYGWFFLLAVLLMACKEEMPLLVIMMGLYALLVQRNWRVGLTAISLGAAWFVMAVYIIIPHYNLKGQSPYLAAYGYLGGGPLGVLKGLLTRPDLVIPNLFIMDKALYLWGLLAPVAFLSLLAPQILLLSLPTLAINLLSTKPEFYTLEKFHYAAPLVPFVVLSALFGVYYLGEFLSLRLKVGRHGPRYLLSALVLLSTLLYHRGHGFTPLGLRFEMARVTPHHRLAEELMALIPDGATISAQSRLNPHLSQRPKIYMFPKVEDAEYVFFDVTVDSWPIHPNDQKRLFDTLLGEEGFGILAAKDGYILLQRGLPGAQTLPQEFYDFARVKNPQIRYPVTVDFGGLLRFLGFDLHEEGGMTSLVLYWQPLAPSGEDYRIYPFFYDEEGRIIEDTTLRPMTVAIWYPTSLWREGEVVRMETLPWEVGEDYYIGLGVFKGQEWESKEERLMAEVRSSPLVVTTFDEGTAVRLLKVRDGFPQPIWRSFQAPKVPNKLQATLGGSALLLGYNLTPPTLHPGDRLSLTLYWQALGEVEKDYTVFVHLLDGGERIWGQRDSFPLGGLRPTTTWVEGGYLIDEYEFSVQPDTPPGEYLIEIGMYDASNGERLPIYGIDGERLPGDRVLLGAVEVTR